MHLYIHYPAYLIRKVNDTLVYITDFQDGSYSRGPVDIPVGEVDGMNYYLSPTFKFEQVSLAFLVVTWSFLMIHELFGLLTYNEKNSDYVY